MTKIVSLILLLISGSLFAQTPNPQQVLSLPPNGGPDSFGYTWKSDQDPQGPSFNWVDITSTGTKITGLGDDNFVGPINLGITFTYYWNDYTQIYVGSNGFISFGQGFNIASSSNPAFRDFPYADTKNNVIGAMLADLTFTKADGSPISGAEAYYQTIGDSFIISFINVPFWSDDADANTGDYKGSTTFQIILNAADSSITINYKNNTCCVDSAYYTDQNGVVVENFISRGMEDITGTMGLDFDNVFANNEISFYVKDSSVVKVYYPDSIQTTVEDLSTNWILNPQSGGIFVEKHPTDKLSFSLNVKNVGTVSMGANDSAVYYVECKEPLTLSQVFTANVAVKGLAAGNDTTIVFNNVIPKDKEGSYFIRAIRRTGPTGGNFNDVNPQNNELKTEIVSVTIDTTDSMAILRYDDGNWDLNTESSIGLGAGVYIEPPKYPATLEFVSADIIIRETPANRGNAIIKIYKNDGPNNGLGTLLDSIYLDVNQFLANVQPQDTQQLTHFYYTQNNIPVDSAYLVRVKIPIPSKTQLTNTGEGVYVAYLAQDNTTLGYPTTIIVTDEQAPFSRRTYEIIGGAWAPYRDADVTDFAMGLIMKMEPDPTVNITAVSNNNVSVYPNPATDYLMFDLNENAKVEIYNVLGNVVKTATINGKGSIFVGDLTEGIYFYKVVGNNSASSGKIVIK